MKIADMEFTIGADPEVFIGKDGKFVSAHQTSIKGSKQNPQKVEKGAVQIDGMALELNIDPAFSEEEFEVNLTTVYNQLKQMVPDFNFLEVASVMFDKEFYNSVPDENKELGCDPDFNAYDLLPNPRPCSGLMRTAGGHVHIGGMPYPDPEHPLHMGRSAFLTRILDSTLGVYSILWDYDDKRRSMYGKAGCFRPKTYGLEYRTLSNAWIFNPKLVKFVYNSVEEALRKMFVEDWESNEDIVHIINESDRSHSFFKNNPKADLVRSIVGA